MESKTINRQDYDILVDRYEQMKKRFVYQNKRVGWLMLLMQAAVTLLCAMTLGVNAVWDICCIAFCTIVLFLSICTNGKLLFHKSHFMSMDMAAYSLINIGGFMGITEFMITGILFHLSVPLTVTFFIITLVVCTAFGITTAKYNRKKLHAGGFSWKNRTLEKPWKIWIWGVTAIPFIPLMALSGRRIWLLSLAGTVQIILIMYMLLWLWLVLIYSLFAPSLLYMRLERGVRKTLEKS